MANEVNLEIASREIFGITSRQYRKHAHEDGAPIVIGGKVNLIQACKWLISYYRVLAKGQGSLSLTDERTRLTKINADRKELQLRKEKGEVINTVEAMRLWGGVCQAIRSKILSMPSKLSPIVLGIKTIPEIKDITEKFAEEILNEIANPDIVEVARMVGDKGNNRHTKGPAATNRKRVGRPRKNTQSRELSGAREVV